MDTVKMDIVYLADVDEGEVYGAPAGKKGKPASVLFGVGARLIAAGFAEPAPEPKAKKDDK